MVKSLIQQIIDRDEGAFEQLVGEYQRSVLNMAYRYTGDRLEAEDITQEVFAIVWKCIKNFRQESKFSTWLYRIVVNQCLQHKRNKHNKNCVSFDEITEAGKSPKMLKEMENDFEHNQKKEIIEKAIDGLPERQKIALILSKFENKSYKEISSIIGVSLSSVESLIFRARENLEKKLFQLKEGDKF
jgi:RNA polymerase sigma-70 factor, ECF subfamily